MAFLVVDDKQIPGTSRIAFAAEEEAAFARQAEADFQTGMHVGRLAIEGGRPFESVDRNRMIVRNMQLHRFDRILTKS
ncbi:hypothetical protein D3C78_1886710 [compost metagenome]